jgi:hypothetical protein
MTFTATVQVFTSLHGVLHKTRVCFSTPSLLHVFSGCKGHLGHQGDYELLKWNRQEINIYEVILEKQMFDSKDEG